MEPGDLDLSPFKNRDTFKQAQADYDQFAGRAYTEAKREGKKLEDLSLKKLVAKCQRPLVIAIDTTGSMGEAPAVIFGKLPLLELGVRVYLGEDVQVSYCSVGDATTSGLQREDFPLQYRPFVSGAALEPELKKLVPEGKGGGTGQESYEQAALYYARQVEMPRRAKPVLIFIGDEQPYDFVDPTQAKKFDFLDIDSKIPTADVFKELQEKYSVYLIRRRYEDRGSGMDKMINEKWVRLIGRDRIARLLDDSRAVDIIFGILARESNQIPFFWKEVTERQSKAQVDLIERCLEPVIGKRKFLEEQDESVSAPLI